MLNLIYSTNNIYFTTTLKNKKGKYSESVRGQSDRWTKNIYIAPSAFNRYTNGNLRRTLYHEMGHTLDYSMSTIEQLKSGKYGISYGKLWEAARNSDKNYQHTKNIKEYQYASKYGKETLQDDFAETVSMVIQSDFIDKSDALIRDQNENLLTYDEWEKYHPNTIKFIKNLLNTIDISQFIH